MSHTRRRDPDAPLALTAQHDIVATAKDSSVLALGTLFEYASRFVIAFLLARLLGAEDYGLYVVGISAATLFSGISLLGLDDAMVRYVAILSGRGDQAGVRGTLQIGIAVSVATGLLLGGVLYLAAAPIAQGLFHEPRLTRLLHLFALVVPFLSVSNVLAGIARGFRRMEYVAFGENVVQSLVRMALLAAIPLVRGIDTFSAAVIFGISDLAATVTLIVLLNREFPLRGLFRDGRRDTKAVFRFAVPLWLSGMLRSFRRNIQYLMLGSASTVSAVGVYEVADKVNLVGHVWLLSILVAVKPTLARLHDRGDRQRLARVYTTATRWTLSVNLPFFAVTLLYRKPLLGVFGDAFTTGTTALILLTFAEFANAATGICGPMIDMTGHTRVKVANSVLWTVLLIGGGALLIPRWGIVGAGIASLVAVAGVNVLTVIEVWALEALLPFDRTFWKPVTAGVVALVVGVTLDRLMPVGRDLVRATPQALVVIGVYAGLLLLFGLEPEDRLVFERGRHGATRLRRRRSSVPRPAIADALLPAVGSIKEATMPAARTEQPGPIYIGGLDRSGKTTMAAFLTSHPNIAIPAIGSNMWTYFYGQYGDLKKAANFERCLTAMMRYKHVSVLLPDAERIRREFADGPATYARLFALVHIHAAERDGKPRWGVQTGLIERYADQLFDAYPGVKIIHMVRDPRDRYEGSLALWPGGKGRAGGATARWTYSMRLAERNLRRHPDGYKIVRYEDMVQQPERTVREVCSFLGESFDPRMLQMTGAPERRERLRAQSSTAPTDVPLSPEFIGRFRGTIPEHEIAFMQLSAGRRMRAYGYERERLDMSAREWLGFTVVRGPDQFARMLAWRIVEGVQQRFPARAGRKPDPRLILKAPAGYSR